MTNLMDKEGVLSLARELMEEYPDNLNSPTDFLNHISESYDIARKTVESTHSRYPGLIKKLIKEEVALASGLHDIARPLRKNQLFHELRGARIIENYGLKKGVADSLINIYRIAQMFRPHFVVAEQFEDEENAEERAEFEPLDSRLLIPRTWQEAIVVYSEISNIAGERVPIQNRIDDLKERYREGSEWSKSNPSLVRSMKKGLPRVLETCESVQKLMEGKLKEEEILRYGFI